jgi:hypothetical protein
MRVAGLVTEGGRITDTRLEMKARPLACKVSALCPLLKVFGNSAQLIYSHKVIIFEVQQTRDSFASGLSR